MKCVKGYEVEPKRSGAGYYMGTYDEDGCPQCRISQSYSRTAEEAKDLPLDRQMDMENSFCNGGIGCFGQLGK